MSGASGIARRLLPRLTLYGKKGQCSLCDEAKEAIEKVRAKAEFEYDEIDITDAGQQEWFERYKYDIPVLHLDGKMLMKHRVIEDILLHSLQQWAAKQQPRRQQ